MAIIRVAADRLDYLVLADCFVVLGQVSGEPLVITDEREVKARRICSAPLAGLDRGTAEYEPCGNPASSNSRHGGTSWAVTGSPRTIRVQPNKR